MSPRTKADHIEKIIEALKKASESDYSSELDFASQKSEVGRIAEAINTLFKRLDKKASVPLEGSGLFEEEARRYRNMLDTFREPYFEFDLKGNLVFITDRAVSSLGYSKEELRTINFGLLMDKTNADKVRDIFRNVYLTGQPAQSFEFEILKKNKEKIVLEGSIELMRDHAGNPIGFRGVVWDVLQRKQAERDLQHSEQKYLSLLEDVEETYLELDLKGNYIFFNNNICRTLGYSREELQNVNFRQINPPEDHQKIVNAFNEVYRTGKKADLINRTIHKNGSIRFNALSVTLLQSPKGEPIGFAIVGRDITERLKAEEKLKESEETYRNILQNMDEVYIEIDLRGHYTFFNDSLCRVLGYTREELQNISFRKINPPNAHEKAIKDYNEIYRTGQTKHFVADALMRKDGTLRFMETTVSLRRSPTGEPIGFSLVSRDITEKLKAEEKIRESERHLRLITDNINDMISTMDFNMQWTYVSSSALSITGFTPEEVMRIPLIDLVSPDAYQLMAQAIAEGLAREEKGNAQEAERPFTLEMEMPRKDGSRFWAEISAAFNRDENGKPFEVVAVTREITLRKKAEEEKDKLEKQLIQAQKMESVGRLAGGVAHDFNNMLSVIFGYVDLIKLSLSTESPILHDIAEIEKAALRSRDIIAQLLAFSRKQIIAPKIIDLNELVGKTQKALIRLIGEDVQLNYHPGENLWAIKVDPSQIEQILFNLAVNARDAMPEGGKLTIETDNITLNDLYCESHFGFKTGDYVRLTVSDNGTGMDKETLQYIFEPFFTTKESDRGTGLGLATVYGIVKQNKGFINVYSEPGQGTTVAIYLPKTNEQKQEQKASAAKEKFTGSGSILLVEDDPMVLKITKGMLEAIGYAVRVAKDPLDAISIYERDTNFDLVITDVVMPIMQGKDLRNRLLEIRPDIKVLFISGYTANAIAHHGVLEEGIHFLQKPFTIKDLALKVQEVMNSK